MSHLGYSFADPQSSSESFDSLEPRAAFADSAVCLPPDPGAIPKPWRNPPVLSLDEILGPAAVQKIQVSGRVAFHALGNSSAAPSSQPPLALASALAADLRAADDAARPAFLFHLGNIAYPFGETIHYFRQFYSPFRSYPAPIFAIPGNYDGSLHPDSSNRQPLDAFCQNFCSLRPVRRPESQDSARTTLTQPGVYFMLEAPFVRIIGLYSNSNEYTGTLRGPGDDTRQLDFLTGQLEAIAAQRQRGDVRALILAVHHPPFTCAEGHVPSPGMLADIDAACTKSGVMPDLVLSARSPLYERFHRTVSGREIPFVVAASGHPLLAARRDKAGKAPTPRIPGTDAKHNLLTLVAYAEHAFPFVRIAASRGSLEFEAFTVNPQTAEAKRIDQFTINLNSHTISDSAAAPRTAERSLTPPEERPQERAATRPAERSVERPIHRSGERSVDRSAERRGDRSAERAEGGSVERHAQHQADRPAEHSYERLVARSTDDAGPRTPARRTAHYAERPPARSTLPHVSIPRIDRAQPPAMDSLPFDSFDLDDPTLGLLDDPALDDAADELQAPAHPAPAKAPDISSIIENLKDELDPNETTLIGVAPEQRFPVRRRRHHFRRR